MRRYGDGVRPGPWGGGCLPDGADEEDGLLGDDGQLAPQLLQPQVGDVDPVHGDGAPRQLHQSEQSHAQGGLACRRTATRRIVSRKAELILSHILRFIFYLAEKMLR